MKFEKLKSENKQLREQIERLKKDISAIKKEMVTISSILNLKNDFADCHQVILDENRNA